ncbi:MAG: peptidase and in, kexin, sedolisin [Spartobacteria bacterium]|nr:peptidase and in, kexin, sedolisin [Spartobacteria bacterium]
MKRKGASQSGFFHPRTLFGFGLGSIGLLLALMAFGAEPDRNANAAKTFNVSNGPIVQHRSAALTKIAPWVLSKTGNGNQAEFLVLLADQADLRGSAMGKTKHEKGRHVRDLLWNKAKTSQAPLLAWLRARNIEYRSYYIVNMIWVKADANVASAIADRSDVLRIEGNPEIHNVSEPADQPLSTQSTAGIEPGISYTGAPEVWSLGYTGQGVVIAGADTGYRWDHAALKNQYRGWDGTTANHNYNWHDSIHTGGGGCGPDSLVPCDDTDHGTHTMGTAVGDDGVNNHIGMAPGAKWIGCRNMDRGAGTPARYIECMEFFLAPYPVGGTTAQGDPDQAPDITTNSWGCPASEGCSATTLQAAVEAQRAAGIFMVAAAGNSGSGCETVQDPPAIYDALYTIGALNNGTDTIASFSSRGPVFADGSLRRKPDLAAPGTNVRSSVKGTKTSYALFSGTSMATPHVAGAVALLWSAEPTLRSDLALTETILNETAAHILSGTCESGGSVTPNNTYGYGRLDIKAAVDRALLHVMNFAREGDAITVTFYAGAGRTYRLERKYDLANIGWESVPGLGDFTATADGPVPLTDPTGGTHLQQFYRVRMIP